MLRRLATIAAALTLAACSDGFTSPTEVTRSQNVGDGVTVPRDSTDGTTTPQDYCFGFASAEIKALIPACRGH